MVITLYIIFSGYGKMIDYRSIDILNIEYYKLMKT